MILPNDLGENCPPKHLWFVCKKKICFNLGKQFFNYSRYKKKKFKNKNTHTERIKLITTNKNTINNTLDTRRNSISQDISPKNRSHQYNGRETMVRYSIQFISQLIIRQQKQL